MILWIKTPATRRHNGPRCTHGRKQFDGKSATLQVVIERGGQFSKADDAKDWATEKLVKPLQAREEELNFLLTTLDGVDYEYGDTDELRGTYSGKVLASTPHFVAQYDDVSKQAVIHDRLMLETANRHVDSPSEDYKNGEILTVRYVPDGAPQVDRHAALSH